MKKRKALVVVLSSVLVFVVLVSSCICNTYSYYFDAMKVKRIFLNNKEKFEYVVDYLMSQDLSKGQKIEFDVIGASSMISDTLVSIGSPRVSYEYYDYDSSFASDEHEINFYYFYSDQGLYLEYSSNDLEHIIGDSYIWKNEKLCDNWYLYYETSQINNKG